MRRITHSKDIGPIARVVCPPLPKECGVRVCGSSGRESLADLLKALPVSGEWRTVAQIARATGWPIAKVGRVAMACPMSVWKSQGIKHNGEIMYRRTPGLCEKDGA